MPLPLQPRQASRPASRPRAAVSVVLHAAALGLLLWLGLEAPPTEPTQAPSFEVAFENASPESALSTPPAPNADAPPAPPGDDTLTPPSPPVPPPDTPPVPTPVLPPPPPEPPPQPEPAPEPAPQPAPQPPAPQPPAPQPPAPQPPAPQPLAPQPPAPEPPAPEPPPPQPPPPQPVPEPVLPAPAPAPATPAPVAPEAPPPPPPPRPSSRLEAAGPLLVPPRLPDLDLTPPPFPEPAPPPPPRPRPRPVVPPPQQFSLNNPGSFDLSPRAPGGGVSRPRSSSRFLDLRLGAIPDGSSSRPSPASTFGQVKVVGAGADYGNLISAWVERHKYYPQQAAQQGEDGDVVVHFFVDRDGRVQDLELADTSGSRLLDMSFLGMFRGQTVPKPPPGGPDRVEVTFRMRYILIRGG